MKYYEGKIRIGTNQPTVISVPANNLSDANKMVESIYGNGRKGVVKILGNLKAIYK